jgi:predicted  nucleic acid-binding Zn-ribbon protein
MKKSILLALVTAVILFSIALVGCQTGITQAQYDQLAAQLKDAQAKYTEVQNNYNKLQSDKAAVDAQLKDAQSQIAQLQGQVGGLKEEATLTGATPAETAAKIVKNYIETHVYSTIDYFICSDMASEVWNMLKAQGIKAVIVVGNKDAAISNILQSDHAWVLAEVGPGEYLALEATGGYVVTKSKNALYYRGWSFESPTSLKGYNELVREYNTRIDFRNQLNDEANKVAELHNNSTSQVEADKYKAVYDKLLELRSDQEARLNNLMSEINGLATPLSM